MTATALDSPLTFARGPAMANRLALAPMTNRQSCDDGTISDDEFNWLIDRAREGYGLVTTCAASTHPLGKGYPRQLGVHSDEHLPGLEHLATALRALGVVSAIQLQHAGARAEHDLIGQMPVGVADDPERGIRGLSTHEVEQAIEDFVLAGTRADRAGFDGVNIHGAHGYLLCHFLDVRRNTRTDAYGGNAENRARAILAVIDGLRERCRPDFQIGIRLSAEGYGVDLGEARDLTARIMREGKVDRVDISCKQFFKEPEDPAWRSRPVMGWFTDLDRHGCRLGIAGALNGTQRLKDCLAGGADFLMIGRSAIVHRDFPARVMSDASFETVPLPVSRAYLAGQGLSPHFIEYVATIPGIVDTATD